MQQQDQYVTVASFRLVMNWVLFAVMVMAALFCLTVGYFMVPKCFTVLADRGMRLPWITLMLLQWFRWLFPWMIFVLGGVGFILQLVCGKMKYTFAYHVAAIAAIMCLGLSTLFAVVFPMWPIWMNG